MTYRIVLLFLWFSIATTGQEPFRNWTDIKGRTVSARFIKFLDSKVIIERESDSRKMPFPISQLSANDQDHITELKAKEAVKASKSLKSNDYKGMLLRPKKWANPIGGSLQRFFFCF